MAQSITLKHLCDVLDYVGQHKTITNRECRIVTKLGYDSAIKVFNALCAVGMLRKTGETSGTKYVALDVERRIADKITVEHLATVIDYVLKHGSITNRKCRDATGVTYNSSIRICGALCSLGMLRKTGKTSTTQYVAANLCMTLPAQPGKNK